MVTYQRCPKCGMDALHTNGVCGFCEPIDRSVDELSCLMCGQPIENDNSPVNKRYCSNRCKDKAWRHTDAGVAWERERKRRQAEKRSLLRSLGVRRVAARERAA